MGTLLPLPHQQNLPQTISKPLTGNCVLYGGAKTILAELEYSDLQVSCPRENRQQTAMDVTM